MLVENDWCQAFVIKDAYHNSNICCLMVKVDYIPFASRILNLEYFFLSQTPLVNV